MLCLFLAALVKTESAAYGERERGRQTESEQTVMELAHSITNHALPQQALFGWMVFVGA